MRDFRDAKTMAQSLRHALATQGLGVTHSQGLELIAKAFGDDNWNVLAARIEAGRPAVASPPLDGPKTLYCSFCGKSQHDVRKLIAGPAAHICDDCVGLCNDVIEHTDLLGLMKTDETAGETGQAHSKLLTYLANRTDAQIDAYLAAAEKGLEGDRVGIDRAASLMAARREGRAERGETAAGDPWPAFLAEKSDDDLARHKALLETLLDCGAKLVEVVRRVRAER